MQELKRTVLFEKHVQLNAKNIGFCGWEMPVQYEGIIKEHNACRTAAALFDTSHMGEFFFEGDITLSGINDAVTMDILKIPIGKCKYGLLLNDHGGIIDDLIVYRVDIDRLMFVVNASRIDMDFVTIGEHVKSGIFTNGSDHTSKLDIQGPKSKEILQELVAINLDDVSYFGFAETTIMNTFAIVSCTGYTGELGYELYVDNAVAAEIWDELCQRGAVPAGLGARDVLRLEKGYSLYGNELDEHTTPLEAKLKFFVNFDVEFTGKKALLKQQKEGIPKKLIPFTTNSKRAPRHGFEVYQNDQKIGIVTSGTFSPSLNSGIGLAYVDTKLYKKDTPLELKNERGSIPIFLATLPFLK